MLKRYPEHSALLHWAYHMVRTELDIPANLVAAFEAETARCNTTYTASDVSRTYSRLATCVGLLSSHLEQDRPDGTQENLWNVFKKIVELLAPNVPLDEDLVRRLIEEFLGLQVHYSILPRPMDNIIP